ncbi:MAG: BamA/TamA family outer membrane protein [Firmicutes bacterium]|nr:BamA/TamA family outer membrane protein [Bacillota bacterium]
MIRRKKYGRFLFLLLFVSALLASVSAVGAQENPMVVMVAVEGNEKVPAEEILAAVKHTQIGAPLDLEAIKADQKAIFELGYFSEVLAPEFRRSLGGVKVVFKVVEYPPFKQVELSGLTKMPVEEALAVFTLQPGETINRSKVANDLRRLMEKAQQDYGLFLKSPSQQIMPDGTVRIELVEMRLGHLRFLGLKKTKEEVVRREIRAQEGEVFDAKAFSEDLQHLFMLGYFESINPRIVETNELDRFDVEIEFVEAKTGTISLSLSYNTNDGEIVGGFKIGDANLFGTGNAIDFSWEMNAEKRLFDLSFTDPWLDKNHTSLTLHLYNDFDTQVAAQTVDENGTPVSVWTKENIKGWEIVVGRPISRKFTVSLAAKHQYLDRVEIPAESPPVWEPHLPYVAPDITTNSLGLRLEYKDLTPQKAKYVYVADGVRAGLNIDFAGSFLGGDTDFVRYKLETAFFKSVSPQDVLALRLMGGLIDVRYDPLETAQFLIGGAETLRGYDYRAFSVYEMALANLEFRHRFTDNVEGVVFYDSFYAPDTGEHAAGYGLGLRIWVPYLGQLRFDYGWPVDGTGNSRFYFSIGEVF